MYVKISNGAVDQYPYTVGNLRRDNPNTSFPKRPSDDMLSEWGMHSVTVEDEPTYDMRTQNVALSDTPALSNGSWTVGWTVTDKAADEIIAYDTGMAEVNRSQRDTLIAETDWWASSDLTMTAEQTAYRQALRDITSHANWPNLDEADWPTKP